MTPLDAMARALALSQSGEDCFDALEPEAQEALRGNVRAVLDSLIRNASEAMLSSGGIAGNWHPDFDEREREAEAAAVLQAMLDAALAE